MITPVPKIKYLTNKDLMHAIHESKLSFCEFDDPMYRDYDIITNGLSGLTVEILEAARQKKIQDKFAAEKKANKNTCDSLLDRLDQEILLHHIVVRLMTFDHIPIDPVRSLKAKTVAEKHVRCQFPPFQHWVWENNQWRCVGKSHSKNGQFSLHHGRVSNRLGAMWMKLVERYGHKGNWRGYCVPESDQALTNRGWLNMREINEHDLIMSYHNGQMKWSSIKSIYRAPYNGLMHKLTNRSIDALITPNHKLMTAQGLVPVEFLKQTDKVILMGQASPDGPGNLSNSLVELLGWIVGRGVIEQQIKIHAKNHSNAIQIKKCLTNLGFEFTTNRFAKNTTCFSINEPDSKFISDLMPENTISMEILMSLTQDQRMLLINTIISNNRCSTSSRQTSFSQSQQHVATMFQALCALAGIKTNACNVDIDTGNKIETVVRVTLFGSRYNQTCASSINMHGGKNNNKIRVKKGKQHSPNQPMVNYHGWVWCPETEYGCFLTKRNGKVYLTGNTYVDEMKAQALVQLSQVGLQFDESKSSNPFSYYTTVVSTSFLKILTTEKKSQRIRDDLLIVHGAMPSYTRQVEDSIAQQQIMAESQMSATGPAEP
jgi:hypothetical protein